MQRNARKVRYIIVIADTAWIFAALALTCGISSGFPGLPDRLLTEDQIYAPIVASCMIAWWAIYRRLGLDGFRRGWQWGKLLSEILVGVAILAGILSACAFLTQDSIPRSVLLGFTALLGCGFVSIRAGVHVALACTLKPCRKAVIIGNGKVAQELSFKLQHHPEMRCEIAGFLYPTGSEMDAGAISGKLGTNVQVQDLGTVRFLAEKGVTDVIMAVSDKDANQSALELAIRCREAGLRVSVVPRTYQLYLSRPSLMDIDGLPLLSLDNIHRDRIDAISKRIVDLAIVLLSLPVTAPLLALAAAYLKVTTGKAVRTEMRCGQNGKLFSMYRLNASRQHPTNVVLALLAGLSITELPQLWNVLRGEMSVVGPRPESAERVRCYSEWQRQRLGVRPGLTGLAQVQGLREESSSEDKARFDLQYIASSGRLFDCVLVVETMWTLLRRLFGNKCGTSRLAFEGAPTVSEFPQC